MQILDNESLFGADMNNDDPEMSEDVADVLALQQDSTNTQAIGRLFERHKAYVFSIVVRLIKDRDAANDLVQDIFLIAARKIYQLQTPGSFRSWIYITAKRAALNYVTRRQIFYQLGDENGQIFTLDEGSMPLELIERQERIHEVQRLICALPDIDREVLRLFYFQGKTLKQIMTDLNIPEGTVKRRLHSARGRMEELIRCERPEYAGPL